MKRFRFTVLHSLLATVLFIGAWLLATLLIGGISIVDFAGWVLLYLVGLSWAVYVVEQAGSRIETRRILAERRAGTAPTVVISGEVRSRRRLGWNPIDPGSRLYGRSSQRLRQSLAVLAIYSLAFVGVYYLVQMRSSKAHDGFDLPEGGGTDTIKASAVKVEKVIRKKFLFNQNSLVIHNVPKDLLDKVDLKLDAETRNEYKSGTGDGATGDGEGEGSGFGTGKGGGKTTFIRIRHGGPNWDRNFGVGLDRNMLMQFEKRTKMKIAEESQSIEVPQLNSMPPTKNPALLFIGGTGQVLLSAADKKTLKQYLLERHGMILGDNLGGQAFHQSFIALMNEITGTTPVAISRDDVIHRRPYPLPQLPFVVAHGGTTPLGWKVDGRWVVYYHPGALSDAWRDDRAGVSRQVEELCYQLGVNIMFYSMAEKNKWLKSQSP